MVKESKLDYLRKTETEKEPSFRKMAKLSKKQKNQNAEKDLGEQRLDKACEIYYNLVEERKTDFNKIKQYLSHSLENLLEEEKIGSGVILLSRIKSPVSVIENWRLGKNLHDIFGITLLTQNEEEMAQIREKLDGEKKYNMVSFKKMNQNRDYVATHFLFNIENEENKKTNVECHMQTHDQYKDVYPHVLYKVRRHLERKLTQEEEKIIQEEIQRKFENGVLAGRNFSNNKKVRLPEMFVACFNENGKMEEIELDELQKLLIMYPFLDITKKSEEISEER